MKELSIEDKAKRYDKVIEELRGLLEGIHEEKCDIMEEDIIKIFPELAESEDERIRGNIIATIHLYYGEPLEDEAKEMIAWLEKQGKHDMGISETTKQELEDNLNKALEKETPESCNEFLEKQGEQNPTLPKWRYKNDNLPLLRDSIILNKYGCVAKLPSGAIVCDVWVIDYAELAKLPKEEIEKQGEKKPDDKVEPKFHNGEWVVTSYGKVNQVIAVDEDGDGFSLDDDTYFSGSWKDYYRLWTIQDAKDGDVLACPNDAGDRDVVFIFKNINLDEGWVFCFCASDANGCFCTNNDYVGNSNSTNISPATKEQRNLLFQKMKEAGYEWDADKKELKKIEQKPADNEMIEILRTEYEKGRADAIEEMQKPAWSEEDENHIQHISDFIMRNRVGDTDAIYRLEQDVNWLNSLKDRYTWKPSDEQIEALNNINVTGCISYAGQGQELINLYNDLKRLLKI